MATPQAATNSTEIALPTTIKDFQITPAQRQAWEMTRAALMWHAPAFTHLLYTMMGTKDGMAAIFTEDVPIAATDGSHLILNPKAFFALPLKQRVFVISHEIMHCVWDHCGEMQRLKTRGKISYPTGKTLPYEHQYMNIAMDAVINDLLITAKTGEFIPGGIHDRNIATGQDSAIDAYEKVYKKAKQQKGGGGQGQGQPNGFGKAFDQHLQPGTSGGSQQAQQQAQHNPGAWKTAVAAAAASAKAMGKLPAVIESFFTELLEPKVDWQEHIKSFFNRRVGSGSYDWRRANRRLIVRDIYAPGNSGHGAGTVVIGFDTSGSIYADKGLIDRFLSEVGGILEDVRPKELIVVWCDADVHRTDHIDECTNLLGLRPVGGGGTDFRPVFNWIEKQDITPDALLYLTDGYGSFPSKAPSYPVLWGNISPKDAVKYPFGEVVDIPTDK